MKKISALILIITLILGVLAGCGQNTDDNTLPNGMNGIDAAKLILANERLNSQLFKNTDSIFDSGAAAFANLYSVAEQNMVKYSGTMEGNVLLSASYADDAGMQLLSSTSAEKINSVETQELSNGSILKIDGNIYKWSNYGEYSNSYEYFLNITNNVKQSAEIGARLIDDTKKYVKIVDTWVNIYGNEYYLHVEDNSEIIYCRSGVQNEICRRYKREDGVNVYEIYMVNDTGTSTRMVYIPGEKYEYSCISGGFNHNFSADNTKGFWEVIDVGQRDFGYNVSCMVLKNDICYDSSYDPNMGEINILKVISPDKKTDIMDLCLYDGGGSVNLKLQAFEGVRHVEIVADEIVELGDESEHAEKFVYKYDVPENPKYQPHTVYFAEGGNCTLVLDNGLNVDEKDTFLDGKINIESVKVSHITMEDYTDGYIAEMGLNISGAGYNVVMDTLEDFLELTGLECRRNFDSVKFGIIQAYTELEQMTKYHCWNESPIATIEDLDLGYANNLAKHKAFKDMFDAIKDAEVIDFNDKEAVSLKIKFAPIVSQTSASVKNEGRTVSVSDFTVSVKDTLLFVVGEKYKVGFAIVGTNANTNSGLVHIDFNETLETEYVGEDVFKVNQTAFFEIPVLAEGEYTLVSYISTADGIRSSGYQPVKFTEAKRYEEKMGNVNVVIDSNNSGELLLSISGVSEIEVKPELAEGVVHSYSDMFAALEKEAYLYGFVDETAVLEMSADGITWTSLTGSETTLEDGSYRLKYSIKNGNVTSQGYVYTVYNKIV